MTDKDEKPELLDYVVFLAPDGKPLRGCVEYLGDITTDEDDYDEFVTVSPDDGFHGGLDSDEKEYLEGETEDGERLSKLYVVRIDEMMVVDEIW